MRDHLRAYAAALLALCLCAPACHSDRAHGDDGGTGDGGTGGGGGGGGPGSDGGSPGCFAAGESEKDGRFGAPQLTFTIPASAIQSDKTLYLVDIQKTFPNVDWQKLDRLYIPAGQYSEINIHNLPRRTAAHPLVITNHGGQVRIGGLPSTYLFSIGGGSHWVLTGRYDPISQTGDAGFPGHRGDCYGNTRGSYGIVVDDQFHHDALGGVAELLAGNGRSGVSVGDSATNFELEYIEIARVTFAGLVLKTDNTPTATMDGVHLHDLYIHDTMSEGLYLGSTGTTANQHVFTNLEVDNNRFVRTGSEAIQLGQLASNSHVHHNVSLFGALNWRHNFECTGQDNNVQYGQRYGAAELDHNLIVGGGATLFIFFPQLVASDPRQTGDGVRVHDNLFLTGRAQAVYLWALGGSSSYVVPGATYVFAHNYLGGLSFTYADEYPGFADPNRFFSFSANPSGNPYVLDGNTYDGKQQLSSTTANVTTPNDVRGTVAPPRFQADGLPAGFDYQRFEVWSPYDSCQGAAGTGRPNPSGPPRTYQQGDFVMYDGTLYRLTATSSQGDKPSDTPAKWQALGTPSDDLRLAAGSPYAGFGLLDTSH